MIAAEILIAPRNPDAPAAPTAAARPTEGAAFAQVLAQRMESAPAVEGQSAALQTAPAEAALTGTEPNTIPATATQLAGLTLTAPAMSEDAATQGAGAKVATGADAGQQTDTGEKALPASPPATGTTAPALASVSSQTAVPNAAPAQTAPTGDPALATTDTAPATADVPVSDATGANTPPEGTAEPDTDAAPIDPAPEPQPDDAPDSAASDAPAEETPDAGADETAPTDPAPQPQTVTLPPLAALIQPLLAPQTGAGSDTPDTPGQTEVTGSTPRQRGMSGRLSTLTDSQTPAQNRDSAPSFTDRLAAAADKAQDNQPTQNAAQALTPQDTLQADTLTDADAQPGTAQPLPLDTRATAPTPTTPQRVPDTAPLDTTQSGWEAALTDRITARNTDLGQEIEITLNPENLGHIRIKLELSDKAATVQIVTDTPQAAQLFQQSEARLADALNRAGLSLTSHDATSRDAGGRDGGQRQGQGPANPRAEAALSGLRGTLSAPAQTGRAANLVNIVA